MLDTNERRFTVIYEHPALHSLAPAASTLMVSYSLMVLYGISASHLPSGEQLPRVKLRSLCCADRHRDGVVLLLCAHPVHGCSHRQQVPHAQGCPDIPPCRHGLLLIPDLHRHGQTPPQGAQPTRPVLHDDFPTEANGLTQQHSSRKPTALQCMSF